MYFFCWFWSCLTNVLNVCIGLVQKSLLGKGMVTFDLHVRRGSDVETSFYKLPRSPWARQNALLCLTLCALNCIVALTSWICQFSANYSRKAALVNVPIIIHSFIYHTICAFSIFFYQVRISFYKSAMLHWRLEFTVQDELVESFVCWWSLMRIISTSEDSYISFYASALTTSFQMGRLLLVGRSIEVALSELLVGSLVFGLLIVP